MKKEINMKRLFIACSILCTLFHACKEDAADIVEDPYLELSQETILAGDTLTRTKIQVSTNSEYWDADVTTPTEWCAFAMNDVPGDRSITIITGQNTGADERMAIVTIFGDGDLEKTITVRQMGTAPQILTSAESFPRVKDDSTLLQLYVRANLAFDVSIPTGADWLVPAGTLEEDSTIYLFTVTRNGTEPRQGLIRLQGVAFNYTKEISVTQLGRDSHYTPGDPSDMGATDDTKIRVSRSSTSSQQSDGESIARSHDGNLSTIWHSKWAGGELPSPPASGIWAVYEMDEATTMDYIIYTPRQDGGVNGLLGELDLYIATSPNLDDYVFYGHYDFGQQGGVTSTITFDETIVKPRKVKFEVKSGRGNFASCAEMEFFARPVPDTSLLAIFTDETFSELQPGVTYSQIMGMESVFLRNIAKYLYNGEYSAERTRYYKPYRHPDRIAAEWKTNPYSLWDNPTGIYARDGEDIVVFVGDTHDETITLGLADIEDHGGLYRMTYPLKQGNNKVRVPHDGLLYIHYYTENYATAAPVKVHVASGEINGYFNSAEHTDADWTRITNNAVYYLLDVVGVRAHLLFPLANLKTINNPTALTAAWDDIVRLEQEFMGIPKYGRTYANRILCHVDNAHGAMYASANHTGYGVGSMPNMVRADKIRGSEVWGPAHEIGHINQIRDGLKWVGLGEVSNNIYSMYVQTSFGNTSRLQQDNCYRQAFTRILATDSAYIAVKYDPYFVRLVPFWQLQLLARAIDKPDLYKDVAERVRTTPDKNYTTQSGAMQLDFVAYCCDALQVDLTTFFEAWGFLRELDIMVDDYSPTYLRITAAELQAAKDAIATKGYTPAPVGAIYLTDQNVNVLKNRQNIVPGTASRFGQTITTSGWSNVMAYKVYSAGDFVYGTPDATIPVPSAYPAASVEVKAVQWDGAEINVNF
jgi:hypothetical protein